MNFNNFGNQPVDSRSGSSQPSRNFPRQGLMYPSTFDEQQNTMGGISKDFVSMIMDELLKNIRNAEEMKTLGSNTSTSVQDHGGVGGVNLQRQGPFTLPRTLIQKTVDEVWRDLTQRQQTLGEMTLEEFLVKAGVVREETQVAGKPNDNGFRQSNLLQRQQSLGDMTLEEFLVKAGVVREETQFAGKPNDNGFGQPNLPQRQQTLGDMTLEEFLVKADVVREEAQLAGKPNDNGLFPNLTYSQNNPGFGTIGFQQAVGQNAAVVDGGSNQISFQFANLALSGNGVQSMPQNQKPQLFPKQTNLPDVAPMA